MASSKLRFDITNKVKDFVYSNIKDMPGNPGQHVLVDRYPKESYGKIDVVITLETTGEDIDITAVTTEGYLIWKSNHPEAIEIIMKRAENVTELFENQATILNPMWRLDDAIGTGNWKVVGYDQGSEYGFMGFALR